jgi:hypothetical protein
MAKKSKQADGKVAAENLAGKPVPRKAGIRNETTGKGAGTRDVRSLRGRTVVDHAPRKGR